MRDDPPEVVPARAADQPAIAAILDEARRWMAGRGIAQWTLPFSDEWIAAKIAADEFWVARLAGEPVAVVRLLWADPLFWGERDDGARPTSTPWRCGGTGPVAASGYGCSIGPRRRPGPGIGGPSG